MMRWLVIERLRRQERVWLYCANTSAQMRWIANIPAIVGNGFVAEREIVTPSPSSLCPVTLVTLPTRAPRRSHPQQYHRFFIVMPNIYAMRARCPERALDQSQELAVEWISRLAVEDYAFKIREVVRDGTVVDWVVIDWRSDSVAHWTVRGFCNRRAKMTFHVYPDGRQARFWANGGKRWRRKAATVRGNMVVVGVWGRQEMERGDRGDEEVLDKITVTKLEGRVALGDGQIGKAETR
ncbi:hypothetical protein F5887DRAFT_925962 [Amanita rubescens]|nr:hypothetical protein F5887DRAFT_925962 [Amanita rubescens]